MSAIDAVQAWIDAMVVGLDLCPFAAGARRGTRLVAVDGEPAAVLSALIDEALALLDAPTGKPATTLLVLTGCADDFEDFLDLVETAEQVLADTTLDTGLQLAHFHPDYSFEGEDADDVSHFTNRAPYPVLHLLRRLDVARAVAGHPDPEGIPARNVARLRAEGHEAIAALIGLPARPG